MIGSRHEECGVFGIFDRDGLKIAPLVYYGLFALQHRGQESCGIAINNDGWIRCQKNMGLVSEVFTHDMINSLEGTIAIGHVRYSTTGASVLKNTQPLVTQYVKGTLSLAHNGNLTNAITLRQKLEEEGAFFQTTVDSEIIAYLVAKERTRTPSVEEAVEKAMEQIQGGYALLVMSPKKLIAARDPYGFKPLCMGKIGNSYVFASETCALDAVGAKYERDVEPGEIIVVDEEGISSIRTHCRGVCNMCIFEYIYFARTDSTFDGKSVYEARIKAGRFLAQDSPVEADLVVGVPESGNAAALGFSLESGIPYGTAFVKNGYVGRTFIKPKQASRESSVQVKLNALREVVAGKRIIMIDDSIVRGTTSDRIVKMLRDAGATEVHVRISSPPFLWPCYFGTDVPCREQLIAYNHTVEEIREIIGADSLAYLQFDRLSQMVDGLEICHGCFDGNYPMDPPENDIRGDYDK